MLWSRGRLVICKLGQNSADCDCQQKNVTFMQVDELHVGRLELPVSLLHTPVLRSPYLSPWCISAAGTGAGPMRSRTDLVRGHD